MVLFYRPDCPYSAEFLPAFEAFAAEFGSVATVLVAKINAADNAIRWTNFRLEAYPTVLLFPKLTKDTPVPYEEYRTEHGLGRDKASLLQFAAAHGVRVAAAGGPTIEL